MRSGRKIHPVELLKPVTNTGNLGDKDISYSVEHQCHAGIEYGGKIGGRKKKDTEDEVLGRYLIVIDFNPDFKSNWRIRHMGSGTEYRVMRMADPYLRNIELHLECETVEEI